MKATRLVVSVVLFCGLSAAPAFADITFFMGAQGSAPVPGVASMTITAGGSRCVNFYMRSNVAFSTTSNQIRFLSATSPGVTENCASAQVDVSDPAYTGHSIPVVDISGCPTAVREGALGGTIPLAANTNYYVGEVCFDATAGASGTSTITFDPDPGQTFVTNTSFANVPIANRFSGTLDVVQPPAIPAASAWGLTAFALILLSAGTVVLRRRPGSLAG